MSERDGQQRISIMMKSEAERQFYLGRAGIHLWYARAPLPGAAPSPEFRFPVDDSAPEPESDPIVPRPPRPSKPPSGGDGTGRHRIAGLQALMADSEPETPKAPESVKPVESPASVVEEPAPVEVLPDSEMTGEPEAGDRIEAHLGFWISERLVLVSGVSDKASERLQDTLAGNILAALGESSVEKPRHIHWPVFGNSRVPGNSMDDFRGILRSIGAEFGARKVLFLGVLVDDLQPARSEWLAGALGSPVLDFPRSLAELAAVPTYKRELWQQLKSALGV